MLIQRRVCSACHDMLKNLYHVYGPHTFFWNIPYLELSSEIPAQYFNLLVNINNFFPVFLLIIIGNSFHLFKFTLHLEQLMH